VTLPRRSLALQFALPIAIVLTMLAAALVWWSYTSNVGAGLDSLAAKGKLTAQIVAAAEVYPLWDLDQTGGMAVLEGPFTDPDMIGAAVLEHGKLFVTRGDASARGGAAFASLIIRDGRPIGEFRTAAAALLALLALLALITRTVTRPVHMMTARMDGLVRGDLVTAIPAMHRRDEIGRMARAVEVFRREAVEKRRLEAAAVAAAAQQGLVVDSLASGLARLALGDLTTALHAAFAPEYERLRTDFNATAAGLRDAMTAILANTAAIRCGAGDIALASDELSRRTEQQAASLAQTAAALDDITATVKRSAAGAGRANGVVQQARVDADHSFALMQDAVAAMGEIEGSAQQIAQIIGLIDSIAAQTKLLALNARVEAARAGDAGLAFAVVASEVGALAQHSALAAKEIKALIGASTRQIGRGVTLVGETGQALGRIVGQAGQITDAIAAIACSAQAQATGLQQVNVAVSQMDRVTKQNAAMAERSTAASHLLQQDAEELTRLTGRFQVGKVPKPAGRGTVAPTAHGQNSSSVSRSVGRP
jgi:methyl-accepting chemotaxis protein